MWIFTYDALRIGISSNTVANLQATVVWAEFATFIAIMFHSRWYLSARLRFASQVLAIVGMVVFASGMLLHGQGTVAPRITLGMIAVGLAAFGVGLAAVYSASLIASVTDERARGTRAGIHEMLVGLGSIVSPWVSGHLMQHFGHASGQQVGQLAAYGCGVAVMLLAVMAQAFVLWQMRARLAKLDVAVAAES